MSGQSDEATSLSDEAPGRSDQALDAPEEAAPEEAAPDGDGVPGARDDAAVQGDEPASEGDDVPPAATPPA
jgi:hypothetical protein